MSANKTLMKRFFGEVVNNRKFEVIDEIINADYINHGFPVPAGGPEAMKQISGMLVASFPDMKITLEQSIEEGDTIANRGYWTGTHKGDFMNVSASGKSVNVSFVDMWKVKDGKFSENWVQMDFIGLLQQIGALPKQ
jgi:predicted SnoaL-like aldol condensation-catalyzing enzyme